ncbi:MAG: hypothetical protein ACO3FT_07340 [Ilumatobacteraceae bacterium]
MNLSPAVFARVREFVAVYPPPTGDGSEAYLDTLREWMRRLCEQIRHDFPCPDTHDNDEVVFEWGWKRASHTRPLSKESLALQYRDATGTQTGLHGWDLLRSASSGSPTLSDDPAHHDLVAEDHQVFVPVDPVDHLSQLPVSTVNRTPLRASFIASTSSFDWHLHRDTRWLVFLASVGISTLRLVVSSVYRQGSTLEDGRAALGPALNLLRRYNMTAMVTINTDTRTRGIDRETCKAHTRLTSDILCEYPDVVLGARLFNENSHSVEQSWASDPAFLQELDAVVDPSIPLAWGANHGGEPVSAALAGGSWIAFHSDRGKTPEENAWIMHDAQVRFNKAVVDDEPIGIYHEAQPGRRVNDPDWAARQITAAITAGLGGTTLHLDAGIVADVDTLDNVQRDAALLFGQRIPRVASAPASPSASASPSADDTTPTPTPRPSFWQRVRRFIRSLFTIVI